MMPFKKFFTQTNFLVSMCFILAFLTGLLIPLFSSSEPSGKPIENILLSVFFFFIGCGGLIMIVRKEFPFFNLPVYGVLPIIIGLLFLVPSWFLAILGLIKTVVTLIH
jgi:hypothetical protein